MPIGIDDIPEDDSLQDKPYLGDPKELNENQNEPQQEEPQEDLITSLLKEKGIDDPSKIKFEDDDNKIEERNWNDLTHEEQLNILNTPTSTPKDDTDDLDDDEIELLNYLRTNGLSAEEYSNMLMKQGADAYARQISGQPHYQIDDLSDDELYVLDLQSRAEGITDEEAHQALEKAKENPELFKKQIDGTRNEYKKIEEQNAQAQQAQEQKQQEAQYQELTNNVLDAIQNMNQIGSLDLEMDDDDKNELANFILAKDGAGVSYLAKALRDPQTLTRMAWFALKGEEAIDSINDYYINEIKKISRSRYEQGLKDGKARKGNSSTVIFNTKSKQVEQPSQFNKPKTVGIDDLD